MAHTAHVVHHVRGKIRLKMSVATGGVGLGPNPMRFLGLSRPKDNDCAGRFEPLRDDIGISPVRWKFIVSPNRISVRAKSLRNTAGVRLVRTRIRTRIRPSSRLLVRRLSSGVRKRKPVFVG